MRILITGADGKLGRCLVASLSEKHEVLGLSRCDLDITDHDAVRGQTEKFDADAILNAAAFTAVDRCEEESDKAYEVNASAVGNLVRAADSIGARLVYFSTDFVFDGSRSGPPYTEEDATNPLSVYGKSKLAGETAALAAKDSIVLRLSWVYGKGGWNFTDWVVEEGQKGNEIKVVTDQMGSPTWVGDVASEVEAILDQPATGIYHCSGQGSCSRFDWAREAARLMGIDAGNIIPITSDQFPQKAPRPAYSVLDNARLRVEGLDVMRPWEDALREYLQG